MVLCVVWYQCGIGCGVMSRVVSCGASGSLVQAHGINYEKYTHLRPLSTTCAFRVRVRLDERGGSRPLSLSRLAGVGSVGGVEDENRKKAPAGHESVWV